LRALWLDVGVGELDADGEEGNSGEELLGRGREAILSILLQSFLFCRGVDGNWVDSAPVNTVIALRWS
jgi:hypothetical protein